MILAHPNSTFCPCLQDVPAAFQNFLRKVAWKLPKGSHLDAHYEAHERTMEISGIISGREVGTLVDAEDSANTVAARLRHQSNRK